MRLLACVTSFVAAGALLAACGALSVQQEFETEADFDGFHTYAWVPPAADETSELTRERLKRAITSELAYRGLKDSPDSADLYVTYEIESEIKGARLTIKFVEATTKRTVWSGWADDAIGDSSVAVTQNRALSVAGAILSQYPPHVK